MSSLMKNPGWRVVFVILFILFFVVFSFRCRISSAMFGATGGVVVVFSNVGLFFRDIIEFTKEIPTAISDNRKLVSKNGELIAKNAKLSYIELENKELAQIACLHSKNENSVSAHILIFPPSPFGDFFISIGKERGVKVGNFVISSAGVIGKVSYVFNKTASVIPVVHPNFSISFIGVESGAVGILHGSGGGIQYTLRDSKSELIYGESIVAYKALGVPSGTIIGVVNKNKTIDISADVYKTSIVMICFGRDEI